MNQQILHPHKNEPALRFNGFKVLRREPVLNAHIEKYSLACGHDEIILTFYKQFNDETRCEILKKRKENSKLYRDKLIKIIEYGFYKKAGCCYDIRPRSKYGPLSNIFNIARSYSRQIPFSTIIKSTFSIIEYFHSRDLASLGLAGDKIVITDLYPLKTAINDIDAAAGFNEESAAADYHDFTSVILDVIFSEIPSFSHQRAYMVHAVTSGEKSLPDEIPAGLHPLLETLINKNLGRAVYFNAIKDWLSGKRGGNEKKENSKSASNIIKTNRAKFTPEITAESDFFNPKKYIMPAGFKKILTGAKADNIHKIVNEHYIQTHIRPGELNLSCEFIEKKDYEKIALAYKIPLEIKNALSEGPIERYIENAREFINLKNENLFISLEEAKKFIDEYKDAHIRQRLYEQLERTAGYYKIAQCIKNSVSPALYEKVGYALEIIQKQNSETYIESIRTYLRTLLYKNLRWLEEDREIINSLFDLKWKIIGEKIYGKSDLIQADKHGKIVIIITVFFLGLLFIYSIEAEKYYLIAFSILIFSHIIYTLFITPDYKKIYDKFQMRIDEAGAASTASRAGAGIPQDIQGRFFHAVKTGNYEAVKKYIACGAEINAKDESGSSALIWAADSNELKILQLLSGYGAEVNARDNQGASALMWAAYKGNNAAVKLLLHSGAVKDLCDFEGHTPLMAACFNSHHETVKILLEAGCAINARDNKGTGVLTYAENSENKAIIELITEAVTPGHKNEIKSKIQTAGDIIIDAITGCGINDTLEFVKAAAAVNKKTLIGFIENPARSPAEINLIKACAAGDYKKARRLIEANTNINARDRCGYTPLIWAIDKKRDRIIDLLLESGANVNTADNYGYTPLIWAIERDDLECIKKLIEKNADINGSDIKGITPLMWSAIKKRHDIARTLLDSGANTGEISCKGYYALSYAIEKKIDALIELIAAHSDNKAINCRTPEPLILWAARRSKTGLIKLAISRGANLDLKDGYGRTALIHSIISRNAGAVKLLIENGANVNLYDSSGAGALIYAVKNWFYDITKMLIKAGAEISHKDGRQKNAMDYAMDNNYNTIIESFVEAGADIDIQMHCGSTLLTWCAEKRNMVLMELLLSKGASIDRCDSKGYSALMHAAKAGSLEIVKLLVIREAKINLTNIYGETALELAIKNKKDKIVSYLKEISQKQI